MDEYIVLAHSPSTGYTQRELQLETRNIGRELALQFAQSYARRMNDQQFMGVADWQPRIELVDPNFHIRTL